VQESIALSEEQSRDGRGNKVPGEHRHRGPSPRAMCPVARSYGQQDVEEGLHANGEQEQPSSRTPAVCHNQTQRHSKRPEEDK